MDSGRRNLIYLCLFVNPNYVNLLELLLKSMKLYGRVNFDTTDILIITDEELQPRIAKLGVDIGIPLKFHLITILTKWEASCARLVIFDWDEISDYDKLLYIDTDILINRDMMPMFDVDLRGDKLYAKAEGYLGSSYWGGQFFNFDHRKRLPTWSTSKFNDWTTAFCAGVLMFRNSTEMKMLFGIISDHINDHVFVKKNPPPEFWDQPFIVYNSVVEDKYDNGVLDPFIVNCEHNIKNNYILYHFPVGPGNYEAKMGAMTTFATKQIEYHATNHFA